MSKDKVTSNPTYSASLKRRSSEVQEVRVVQKPRKMNLVKPKRIQNKTADFANSALLVFPTDSLGITSELKAALIRAGSRVGKDEAALALVKEVLGIGIKHIEARFEQNKSSQGLKRRVDTSAAEAEEVAEGSSEDAGEVSYEDMLVALKDAGVKPASRRKDVVAAAYAELTAKKDEEGAE